MAQTVDTWMREGLNRLEAEVAQAAEAEEHAHRAYANAAPDAGLAPLIDYVKASTRRNTLNEAGLIITLGTMERVTDGEVQP